MPNRSELDAIGEGMRAHIRTRNELDEELYRYAVTLFEEQLSEYAAGPVPGFLFGEPAPASS
jgi:hypothetical protein